MYQNTYNGPMTYLSLSSKQTEFFLWNCFTSDGRVIRTRTKTILVSWLCDVYFTEIVSFRDKKKNPQIQYANLSQATIIETLYLTVLLLEKYLMHKRDILLSELQMYGLCALYVASQIYDEMLYTNATHNMNPMKIKNLLYLSKNSYTITECSNCIYEMLNYTSVRFCIDIDSDVSVDIYKKRFIEYCGDMYGMCNTFEARLFFMP